jgi:hypothetical protein
MPRGKSSRGNWNFRVTRYVCPTCKRKGLYGGWIWENHSYRQAWICMYKNCNSRNGYDTLFRKANDTEVLKVNPCIKQHEHNSTVYL